MQNKLEDNEIEVDMLCVPVNPSDINQIQGITGSCIIIGTCIKVRIQSSQSYPVSVEMKGWVWSGGVV